MFNPAEKRMETRIFICSRDAWQEGWFQNPNDSFIKRKVFFGRLTINLLVTKSEEFWSCEKKNQKMRWWPQSLGDKRKRQKKEMVTSWLVLLLITLLLPATWSGPQQTGDRSKGEMFSVFVHIIVNGIHSIHHSLQGQWNSEGSEGENNDQTKYG